jgi:hypothetical protein
VVLALGESLDEVGPEEKTMTEELQWLTKRCSRRSVSVSLMGVRGRVGNRLVEDCRETKEVGFLFNLGLGDLTWKENARSTFVHTVWFSGGELLFTYSVGDELCSAARVQLDDDELRFIKKTLGQFVSLKEVDDEAD